MNEAEKVLERVKAWANAGKISADEILKRFPEMLESEDERIRKGMIRFLESEQAEGMFTHEARLSWIAYLEKLKEQKPVQEIEPIPIFRIGDILKRKGKSYTFRVDRIQGGYYHCDRNHGAFFPIEEQGNWELIEQKPVEWSEEDEKKISELKTFIVQCNGFNKANRQKAFNMIDALHPQKKQNWRPNAQQLAALDMAIETLIGDPIVVYLVTLREDFKKL